MDKYLKNEGKIFLKNFLLLNAQNIGENDFYYLKRYIIENRSYLLEIDI